MKVLPARRLRLLGACAVSVASAVAVVAPGSASAALGEQCSGASITGQGASVEKIAQISVWTPSFNISADKFACNSKQGTHAKPTVTYTSTSSGAGLKSWGAEPKEAKEISFAVTNAFIGTAEAPTANQITEIESRATTPPATETLETLPTAQFALAIYVNLPTGCTATSTSNPGRLVLNNSTLQAIYAGVDTTWGEIKDGGDTLTPTTCGEDPIIPVVRGESAGTTHVLKRYLGLINSGELVDESLTNPEATWDELSDGSLNVDWPTAAKVVKTTASGDGAEASLVAKTPGAIGYSNLAELRAGGLFSGAGNGPTTAKFWVPIQNSEKISGKKVKITYKDPASNGDVELPANANCKNEVYTNGKHGFPPPAVTSPWNEVTTETTSKVYTLCGFTYVLAFTAYSDYTGTSLTEATTVNNYLRFVLDTKGGQSLINDHDYLALPKGEVLNDAVQGAASIGY